MHKVNKKTKINGTSWSMFLFNVGCNIMKFEGDKYGELLTGLEQHESGDGHMPLLTLDLHP